MTPDDLHGFVPAIVTPFTPEGEIMEDAFVEIGRFLVGRGASAICVAGDNGESWALSAAERGRLVRCLKDALGVPVILGVSAPTLAASLSYVRAGEENGADALLSMPPTYVLKASREELLRRFGALAAATRLPVVLYNSPRRAGHAMDVGAIAAVADSAPVIGIKESHRDFFHHTHLLNRMGGRIAVMTGPCHFILPSLALGAAGFIATGPEFITARPADLPALAAAAPGAAYRQAHRELTVIYEALMAVGTWPAAFKAALGLIGLPAGVPRDPVLPASPAEVEALRRVLGGLGIGVA
jgi:4-hydroxy-tetrahydrodipicolinate synthase